MEFEFAWNKQKKKQAGFIQSTVEPPQMATSLQRLLFVVPDESQCIDSCLNLSTMATLFCPLYNNSNNLLVKRYFSTEPTTLYNSEW